MKIDRHFTQEGQDPYQNLEFETRSSVIRNPDGSVVSEWNEVVVPKQWSQVATDIMAQKYFRKAGVPNQVNPGPLLRDERYGRLMAMPMKAERISRLLKKELEAAAREGGHLVTSKLSGHAPRRGATQAAREAIAAGRSKATEADVNLHFKWHLRRYRRTMQIYYAGMRPLGERLEVTAHI